MSIASQIGWRGWVGAMFIVGTQVGAPGCLKDIPVCVPGLEEGKSYQFTIVEPYAKDAKTVKFDESSVPAITGGGTCGDTFDLAPGSTIVIRIDDIADAQPCRPPGATFVSASNVTFLSTDYKSVGGGNIATFGQNVQIGEQCKGRWITEISVPQQNQRGGIYASNNSQEPPHILINRRFVSQSQQMLCTSANHPNCGDVFVATVSPL